MWLIIILLIGIIILFYGLFLCQEIRKKIKIHSSGWLNYNTIFFLIIFFILGYAGVAIHMFQEMFFQRNSNISKDTLVCSVFLLGALFIVVVLKINKNILFFLEKTKDHLKTANAELKIAYEKLGKDTDKMKEAQSIIQKKNQELEKALDDFYTLRLEMQEETKDETIKSENNHIKERIDSVVKHE